MICLDSTAIIDYLKGRREAKNIIEKNLDFLATTEINVLEVFFGVYSKQTVSKREETSAAEFFNSLNVLQTKRGAGKLAAQIIADLIKKGAEIEQNDALIASIMIKNGCGTIITKNKKHFSKIKGIKVISY